MGFGGLGNPDDTKDSELVLHPRFAAERAVGCGCNALYEAIFARQLGNKFSPVRKRLSESRGVTTLQA